MLGLRNEKVRVPRSRATYPDPPARLLWRGRCWADARPPQDRRLSRPQVLHEGAEVRSATSSLADDLSNDTGSFLVPWSLARGLPVASGLRWLGVLGRSDGPLLTDSLINVFTSIEPVDIRSKDTLDLSLLTILLEPFA